MVKHTQKIRRQQPTNCLSVFDSFMRLALKGLIGKMTAPSHIKSTSTQLLRLQTNLSFTERHTAVYEAVSLDLSVYREGSKVIHPTVSQTATFFHIIDFLTSALSLKLFFRHFNKCLRLILFN